MSRIPLAQLLFQIVVLLSEAFHDRSKGLHLSLKGRRAWFVSLNVVGGHHQSSKYHATLCPGNVCYDLQIYYEVDFPQTVSTDDAEKVTNEPYGPYTSKPHGPYTLETTPT